ncbi:MAG TPA: hypothetical protein VGS28_04840 [Candidatus Saccharimonadales bacterium]|nr:hypothetical protein [Candidatus Saccharimonadales bacterium]
MPKRAHPKPEDSLQKKFINKIILLAATIQPLGSIPQVITIYQHRNATSIAIVSWIIYVFFDLLWLWYGIDNKQKAVIISAVLFALFEGAVAVGGMLYGGSW